MELYFQIWEVICPPGMIRGFYNTSLEPIYLQVMLGRGRPDTIGYADDGLYEHRYAHLQAL